MEPTNHLRKENDLPNLHDYVPMLIFRGVVDWWREKTNLERRDPGSDSMELQKSPPSHNPWFSEKWVPISNIVVIFQISRHLPLKHDYGRKSSIRSYKLNFHSFGRVSAKIGEKTVESCLGCSFDRSTNHEEDQRHKNQQMTKFHLPVVSLPPVLF